MAGRKQITIDWNKVDSMLKCQAKGTEVAAALGIHPDTLYAACKREHDSDFSAYAATKREAGLVSLRAKQFELALKGNPVLCIWLGKQYLNQRDRYDFSKLSDDELIALGARVLGGSGEAQANGTTNATKRSANVSEVL